MNTIKSDISEAYKVQVVCLEDSEPDSFDKNDVKEKANDLGRLLEPIQEKLKKLKKNSSILRTNQILTLLPDKWSRKYCSEYFNVVEYLV